MDAYGQKFIGYKDGLAVYLSETAIAQVGERRARDCLGMIRRYPVKIDLSGRTVMVEGDSHEDAVERYLAADRRAKRNAKRAAQAGSVE